MILCLFVAVHLIHAPGKEVNVPCY